MRKILPIKLKVLGLILVIPAMIIGSFFFLAQQSIVADKKAQALERGISENESLNNKLVHALAMVEQTAKLIIKAQKITTTDTTEILGEIFYAQENLLGLYLYRNNEETLTPLLLMEKPSIVGLISSVEEQITRLSPLQKIIQVQSLGPNNEKFIFYYLNLSSDEGPPIHALMIFPANFLQQSFTATAPLESYLIDLNGNILISNNDQRPEFSAWLFFPEIIQQKISIGTKIERDYLVSVAKFDAGNYLVSMIPQKNAFMMARILQKNFILLALAFLSLASILGIIFANGITHKLKILAWHAERLGSGDLQTPITIKSWDETGVFGQTFEQMRQKISHLLAELTKYSQQLELKVEQRTRELQEALDLQKAMVDSLGQGFLIFNAQGMILNVYSKTAQKLFGQVPSGKYLDQLLCDNPQDATSLRNFCKELVREPLPFDDMAMLAPQKWISEDQKVIFLEYFPLRNNQKKITGVVLVATDKTEEIKAKEQAENEKSTAKMIIKITLGKMSFLNYLQNAHHLLKNIKDVIEQQSYSKQSLQNLYGQLHTLKGNSSLFHLKEIQEQAHQLEKIIANLLKLDASLFSEDDDQDQQKLFEQHWQNIFNAFETFFKNYGPLISVKSWSEIKESMEVDPAQLKQFFKSIETENIKSATYELFYREIYTSSLAQQFLFYNDLIAELSQQLDKPMEALNIQGQEVKVFVHDFKNLINATVHALRNSMDHGIESRDERREQNKPEKGTISIIFRHFEKKINQQKFLYLRIIISDDGRGIHPDLIRSLMQKKNYDPALLGQSDSEIIQHIFDPEFSSTIEATSLSGRGVGLSALKDAAIELKGTITAISKPKQGLAIQIEVPST